MKYPSIFNDVIGPVMRGPSSSHCAGAHRIGTMARNLMGGKIGDVLVQFDSQSALATTHQSQGSDMGLFAGLLGWDLTDKRLTDAPSFIRDCGIKVSIEISALKIKHPNAYKLRLNNSEVSHDLTAVSAGGGMIEILELDGINVSIAGDCFEILLYFDSESQPLLEFLKEQLDADETIFHRNKKTQFIEIKAQKGLKPDLIGKLRSQFQVKEVKTLMPVLPVLSRKDMRVPFLSCDEMLNFNRDKNLELWELAIHYESKRGNLAQEEVFQKMNFIVLLLEESIQHGLEGTQYEDRILGYQSGNFQKKLESNSLLQGEVLNRIILYVTSLMEMKSAMEVIVAAPTAGACAALPGVCIGAGKAMGQSINDMTKAMLAAGIVGIFIAAHATFAAEIGGCQAECGAASGMAAAALVTLGKGTLMQAINAASMALQNIFGMVCDPVANRVEVPCLGKNVMAASNALACANMAMADFDPVIPLDEVIEAMDKVGRSLPPELRCTALGGLSLTKTSKEIEKRLSNKSNSH